MRLLLHELVSRLFQIVLFCSHSDFIMFSELLPFFLSPFFFFFFPLRILTTFHYSWPKHDIQNTVAYSYQLSDSGETPVGYCSQSV